MRDLRIWILAVLPFAMASARAPDIDAQPPIWAEKPDIAGFNKIENDHLAAYYTYMWDEVIAQDFYAQFDSKDPFAGNASMRYRHKVLEPGGSMSANDLVKAFLGRAQNTVAFKRWMSEEFADSPARSR